MSYRSIVVIGLLWGAFACGRVGYTRQDSLEGDSAADTSMPDAALMDAAADTTVIDAPADTVVDAASDVADTAPPPDTGTCDESPCRLVLPQCGCPSGQMCTRATAGSMMRSCRPNGSLPLASPCSFSTECSPGHACIRVNGQGVCARWCETSSDCTTECMQLVVGDDVGACRVACSPIDDTGCPSGFSCFAALGQVFETGAAQAVTICGGPGAVAEGGACSGPFDCQAGLSCPTDTCRQLCDVDAPSCATGACNSLGWTVDGVRIGECR